MEEKTEETGSILTQEDIEEKVALANQRRKQVDWIVTTKYSKYGGH